MMYQSPLDKRQQDDENEQEETFKRYYRSGDIGRHSTNRQHQQYSIEMMSDVVPLRRIPRMNRPFTSRPRFYYYVGMAVISLIVLILLICIANLVIGIAAL